MFRFYLIFLLPFLVVTKFLSFVMVVEDLLVIIVYRLFCKRITNISSEYFLRGASFPTLKKHRKHRLKFIERKSSSFYVNGIRSFPSRNPSILNSQSLTFQSKHPYYKIVPSSSSKNFLRVFIVTHLNIRGTISITSTTGCEQISN